MSGVGVASVAATSISITAFVLTLPGWMSPRYGLLRVLDSPKQEVRHTGLVPSRGGGPSCSSRPCRCKGLTATSLISKTLKLSIELHTSMNLRLHQKTLPQHSTLADSAKGRLLPGVVALWQFASYLSDHEMISSHRTCVYAATNEKNGEEQGSNDTSSTKP